MTTLQTDALLFLKFLAACWKMFAGIFLYGIVPVMLLMIPFIKTRTKIVREAADRHRQ